MIGVAAGTSFLFATVLAIFGILLTRNVMDLIHKKYVVKEGRYTKHNNIN